MSGWNRQEQPAAGCRRASGSHKNQPAAGNSSDKGEGKFECEECGKTFPSGRVLLFHKRAHNDRKHRCKECGKKFTLKYDRFLHSFTHRSVGYYRCQECDQTFLNKSDFDVHTHTHTGGGNYDCSEGRGRLNLKSCLPTIRITDSDVKFKDEEDGEQLHQAGRLNGHSLIHTGAANCDSIGQEGLVLGSFLDTHHLTDVGVKCELEEGAEKVKLESCPDTEHLTHIDLGNHECDVNQVLFPETDPLADTERTSADMEDSSPDIYQLASVYVKCNNVEYCVVIDEDSSVDISPSTSTPLRYECFECHEVFSTKKDLKSHAALHNDKGLEYQCDECGEYFFYQVSLKKHLHGHTNVPNNECHKCGTRFFLCGDLKQHLAAHEGIKRFECHLCGTTFLREYTLAKHVERHTLTKNHKCDICGNFYISRRDVARHMQTHLRRSLR